MRRSKFSNRDVLAIARWMVRSRLLETLYEADPVRAFDVRIRDDFAELVEGGFASFIDAAYDRQGGVRVDVHFEDCRYEFGAAAIDGQIAVESRAEYFDLAGPAPARSRRSLDKQA